MLGQHRQYVPIYVHGRPSPRFLCPNVVLQVLDENPLAREAIELVSDMGKAEHRSSAMGSFQVLPPIKSLRGFTKASGCSSVSTLCPMDACNHI
jgi:hypothetical protein